MAKPLSMDLRERVIVVEAGMLRDVAGGALVAMVERGQLGQVIKTGQEFVIFETAGLADIPDAEVVDNRTSRHLGNRVVVLAKLVEHRTS